jgi:hypothetical protein
MDIGELELRLPTVSEMNEQMLDFIKEYVLRKAVELVNIISADENLPRDKLMEYIQQIDLEDITTISVERKPRRQIGSEDRCCAKTSKGERCTRKRKSGSYCGSHCNSRPYGVIEHEDDVSENVDVSEKIRAKPTIIRKDVTPAQEAKD